MLKLPKPQSDAKENYRNCVSAIRNLTLKSKLKKLTKLVAKSSDLLTEALENGNVVQVDLQPNTPGVTAKQLQSLYKSHMARKGSRGREVYDEILVSAPAGKCPLCAQRNARTLDHFMPQSEYPILSLVPINLVPSCIDCNKDKLDAIPLTEEEVGLHPYFDDIESEIWLTATLLQTSPPTTTFAVTPPPSWDPVLVARVRNHFTRLKLGLLYSIEAGAEFSHVQNALKRLHQAGGREAVRQHLVSSHQSSLAYLPNSWRTACYLSWSQSDWFCDLQF